MVYQLDNDRPSTFHWWICGLRLLNLLTGETCGVGEAYSAKNPSPPPVTNHKSTKPLACFCRPFLIYRPFLMAKGFLGVPHQSKLRFSDLNDLLLPGYLPMETGFCRMPNGRFFVAVRTELKDVTTEMINWWFDWHPKESLRYRVWFPEAHFGISMKDKDRHQQTPDSLPHWHTTHYPIEDVGLGSETIAIHFLLRAVAKHGQIPPACRLRSRSTPVAPTEHGLFMVSSLFFRPSMPPTTTTVE